MTATAAAVDGAARERPGEASTSAPRRQSGGKAVRTDIQALRAIAVSSVVVYHLWPQKLTGGFAGVDVFFVISGFLITTHLMAHPPDRIRNLFDFWSRRIRRLLPAALLVLVAVLVASRLVAPSTQWESTASQTKAAALYFVNWRLASDAVNYLSASNAPTAVQHFWSLSVEEQFYLFWPVLILLLVLLARLLRRDPFAFVFTGLAVVVAASLWYSVDETSQDAARAFFVTPARVWELGIGGLLAVLQSRRRSAAREARPAPAPSASSSAVDAVTNAGRHRHVPAASARPFAVVLVWAGLAAIVYSMFAFDGGTPWPGWHALVPTLGCVAVIAAGNPAGAFTPAKAFGFRPVQWLGDISYSLYLWHWPLVVLEPDLRGNHLAVVDKLGIVVVALALAVLSKRFVEDPFRRPKWSKPLIKPFVIAAVGMAVVVSGCTLQTAEVHHDTAVSKSKAAAKVATHDPCFGAPALPAGPAKCPPVTSGTLTPDAAAAAKDQTPGFENQPGVKDCLAETPKYEHTTCSYGPVNSKVQIAVEGNSHAFQFMSPLALLAQQEGWHITTYVAASCTLNDVDQKPHIKIAGDDAGCTAWSKWVGQTIASKHYDLVITAARLQLGRDTESYSPSPAQYAAGYVSALTRLEKAGEKILAIHDSPSPVPNIPECLAENTSDYTKCDGTRAEWLHTEPLFTAAAEMHDPGFTTLDLTRFFCTATTCPAVIGGVPVYFDNSHITDTFGKTLAPYMEPAIANALKS